MSGRGYMGKNYDPNYAANKGRGTTAPTKTAWNANAKPFQPAALRAAQQQDKSLINTKLSDDLLEKIFSKLSNYSDLVTAAFVCKKWKRVSSGDALWKPLTKKYYLFENGTFSEANKIPMESWKSFFSTMLIYEEQMMNAAFEEFSIDQPDNFDPNEYYIDDDEFADPNEYYDEPQYYDPQQQY